MPDSAQAPFVHGIPSNSRRGSPSNSRNRERQGPPGEVRVFLQLLRLEGGQEAVA